MFKNSFSYKQMGREKKEVQQGKNSKLLTDFSDNQNKNCNNQFLKDCNLYFELVFNW